MDVSSDIRILKKLFREYYEKADLILPNDLYVREVAIQPIDSDIYIRHLSFASISELKDYIMRKAVPKHLYYSSARYRDPANQSMDEKGWMGSDMVFDMDSNEIQKCREMEKVIEFKFCRQCGYIASSIDEKQCPKCGNALTKFEHVEPECISISKEYVKKLVDIIEKDFGFTAYRIVFSGNRGFHIIVELPEEYRYMSSDERREIVSYIRIDEKVLKLILQEIMEKGNKKYISVPPRVTDGGIRRRLAYEILNLVKDDAVKNFMLGISNTIDYYKIRELYNYLSSSIDEIVKNVPIPIDVKVSIDITHLVRVPKSLNGKTGWIAYAFEGLDQLEDFELLPEYLSPFKDIEMKIKFLVDIPRIRVLDSVFKFRRGDTEVLKAPYASYFILKNVAKIVEN